MQKKLQTIRNQKGFTLIEIISVLIILGILAAVAIPRYIDLQDEARRSAAQGGIAEIQSRLSTAYARDLLANGGDTDAIDAVADILATAGLNAGGGNVGDFTYTLTGTDTETVNITISQVNDVATTAGDDGNLPNADWTLPQN